LLQLLQYGEEAEGVKHLLPLPPFSPLQLWTYGWNKTAVRTVSFSPLI